MTLTPLERKLLEALRLAIRAHGVTLTSHPPQDAWLAYKVEAVARAAIAAAEAELNKPIDMGR